MRGPLCAWAVMGCLVASTPARAQSTFGSDVSEVAILSGPPALGALFCDVAMAINLSQDGTTRRGFSITGLVFSGVDVLDSVVVLMLGLSSGSRQIPPLAASAIGLGVASGAFAFYGIFHAPPEPPEPPPGQKRTTPSAPLPSVAPSNSAPIQLRLIPWAGQSTGGLSLIGRF